MRGRSAAVQHSAGASPLSAAVTHVDLAETSVHMGAHAHLHIRTGGGHPRNRCGPLTLRRRTEAKLPLLKEGLTDGRSGIRATGDKGSAVQTHFFPVFTPKENGRTQMEMKEAESSETSQAEEKNKRGRGTATFQDKKRKGERKKEAIWLTGHRCW